MRLRILAPLRKFSSEFWPPAEGVRPPPRGFPWKPPFACFGARLVSAMVRSLIAILYGMLSEISCLSCYPALFFCPKGGRSVGTTLSGSTSSCFPECWLLAFWGRIPWWGGACASRYHGPSKRLSGRRGGPWAPPPLVFLILLEGLFSLVGDGNKGFVLVSCLGFWGIKSLCLASSPL